MMKRNYTVSRKPGHTDNTTPELRIGGKWLSKAGLNVGDHVELTVDTKLIIITPIEVQQEDEEEYKPQPAESLEAFLRKKRARPQEIQDIYRKMFSLPSQG